MNEASLKLRDIFEAEDPSNVFLTKFLAISRNEFKDKLSGIQGLPRGGYCPVVFLSYTDYKTVDDYEDFKKYFDELEQLSSLLQECYAAGLSLSSLNFNPEGLPLRRHADQINLQTDQIGRPRIKDGLALVDYAISELTRLKKTGSKSRNIVCRSSKTTPWSALIFNSNHERIKKALDDFTSSREFRKISKSDLALVAKAFQSFASKQKDMPFYYLTVDDLVPLANKARIHEKHQEQLDHVKGVASSLFRDAAVQIVVGLVCLALVLIFRYLVPHFAVGEYNSGSMFGYFNWGFLLPAAFVFALGYFSYNFVRKHDADEKRHLGFFFNLILMVALVLTFGFLNCGTSKVYWVFNVIAGALALGSGFLFYRLSHHRDTKKSDWSQCIGLVSYTIAMIMASLVETDKGIFITYLVLHTLITALAAGPLWAFISDENNL